MPKSAKYLEWLISSIFSVLVPCIAAPLLARVAYEFRPPEYFALTLFGLSMLASISSGGAVRNLMGGVFGVWLATIGAERATGIERFMFGNYEYRPGTTLAANKASNRDSSSPQAASTSRVFSPTAAGARRMAEGVRLKRGAAFG